jgi:signal transduction histidine kinase
MLLAWLMPVLLTAIAVMLAWPASEPAEVAEVALQMDGVVAGPNVLCSSDWFERDRGAPMLLIARFDLAVLPAEEAYEPLVLKVRLLTGAFTLSLNGQAVVAPKLSAWQRARDSQILLPQSALRAGTNELQWQWQQGQATLANLKLFPASALTGFIQQQSSPRFAIANAAASVTLILMLAGIWLTRRHAQEFLLFALGVLFWAAYSLLVGAGILVISLKFSQILAHLFLQGFVLCIALFARRFAAKAWVGFDRLLCLLAGIAAAGLLVSYQIFGIQTIYSAVSGAHRLLLLAFGVVILWELARYARAQSDVTRALLAGTALSGLVLGVHDALSFAQLIDTPIALIGVGLPVALTSMGVMIVLRYGRALHEAKLLNQQLDTRVQAKAAALETLYLEHAELERKRTLDGERERILRDMHDGVGGRLVALIAASEREDFSATQLRTNATAALRDLRWMIDSLDSEIASELAVALGNFFARVLPMFEQAEVAFKLVSDDLPDGVSMAPARLLQLFRFCDEALQNALKHSHARLVVLRAALLQQQTLALSISDNGCGFDHRLAADGRGLRHLRQRAAALNAEFELHSDSNGSSLRLLIPLLE